MNRFLKKKAIETMSTQDQKQLMRQTLRTRPAIFGKLDLTSTIFKIVQTSSVIKKGKKSVKYIMVKYGKIFMATIRHHP